MNLRLAIQKFAADEGGVTMIEYALLAALIAVALIVAIGTLKTGISDLFTAIGNCLTNLSKGTACGIGS